MVQGFFFGIYEVFLPQQDGYPAPDPEGLTEEELTEKEYYVRGCTALLDAVGRAHQRGLEKED